MNAEDLLREDIMQAEAMSPEKLLREGLISPEDIEELNSYTWFGPDIPPANEVSNPYYNSQLPDIPEQRAREYFLRNRPAPDIPEQRAREYFLRNRPANDDVRDTRYKEASGLRKFLYWLTGKGIPKNTTITFPILPPSVYNKLYYPDGRFRGTTSGFDTSTYEPES